MADFLFLYIIRFSLQLFFCEFLFAINFKRRELFLLRLLVALSVYFGFSYLLYYGLIVSGKGNLILMSLNFLLLFLLSIAVAWFLFDIRMKDALFIGIGGYATQHITYVGQSFIELYWLSDLPLMWENVLLKVLPYLIVGLPMYFFVIKPNVKIGEQKDRDIKMIFLGVIVIIAVIFLSVFANYDGSAYHQIGRQSSGWIVSRLYGILSCILALFMEFSVAIQNKLQHDNDILEQLIQLENEQHSMSKESIEMINMKYHDLKHQFGKIMATKDLEEGKAYYEEMSNMLNLYDSMLKTGNEALDVVLTEKSLLCDKYHIKFSCMIDGTKLNFISTPDLYALFGNALDNAIESVSNIENEEKRIISMTMNQMDSMLYIHIENYCENKPVFKNGLPQSSKKNKHYHGFGVRSIKYIVERYSGEMVIDIKDHRFNLDMLFPV